MALSRIRHVSRLAMLVFGFGALLRFLWLLAPIQTSFPVPITVGTLLTGFISSWVVRRAADAVLVKRGDADLVEA